METNEIIGWLATGLTMLSFLFQRMLYLRMANFSACIIWVIYGVFSSSNPVIVTNAVIAMIHIRWFITNKNGLKNSA